MDLCASEDVIIASTVLATLETFSSGVIKATLAFQDRGIPWRRLALEQAIADALRPFTDTTDLDIAISAARTTLGSRRGFATAHQRVFIENVRACNHAFNHSAFPHKYIKRLNSN